LGLFTVWISLVEASVNAILNVRFPLIFRLASASKLPLVAVMIPVMVFVVGVRAEAPPTTPIEEHPRTAATLSEKPQSTPVTIAVEQERNSNFPLTGTPERDADTTPKQERLHSSCAAVRGRVVLDSTGVAMPRVDVRMLTHKENGYKTTTTTTDAQGEFVFDNVPTGAHHFFALADDLASRQERYHGMQVVFDPTRPTAEPLVLKMSPAPSIKAHVTAKDGGAPIADANVKLVWSDIKGEYKTDPQGNIVFRGLTPEVWHVEVHAHRYAEQVQPVNLTGDQRVELSFALDPGGSIHGVVRNDASEPLAGVGISVFPADHLGEQIEYMRSDAEGRYRFDFLPLDQPLQLNCSHVADYQDPKHKFTLASEGKRDVDLDLVLSHRPDGGSIKGRVTDREGKLIVGATLTNPGRSSDLSRKTKTDAEGQFALDNVYECGSGHELIVKASGFAPQQVTFQPGPRAAPTELSITLLPGHCIRGRVQDAAGQPIAKARVFYAHGDRSPDGGIGGWGTTDGEGRFAFDSLPANSPFSFDANGYSRISETFLSLDGEDIVVVTMRPQGMLRGRVLDAATGAPISRFNVRITFSPDRRPDDPKSTLSGPRAFDGVRFVSADGQFQLKDLVADMALQVSVEAEQYGTVTERRVLAQADADATVIDFKLSQLDPTALATLSGKIVDEIGRPIPGAELRLIIAKDRPVPRDIFPFNWEMIRSGQVAHVDKVVQSLATTSDKQGAFHFNKVRMDAEVELAYWGEGVTEGRKEHLEQLTAVERECLRVITVTPGAVQGTIHHDMLAKVTGIAASIGHRAVTEWLDKESGDTKYAIRNLPPGEYVLHVFGEHIPNGEDRGFTTKVIQRKPVRIESGKTVTVDIGMDKRTVTGRLLMDQGVPGIVENAKILITPIDPDYEDEQSVTCSRDGAFSFETAAASIVIFARTGNGRAAGSVFTGALTDPIEVRLRPTLNYEGQLLGNDNLPASGRRVFAIVRVLGEKKRRNARGHSSFDALRIEATTDEQGNFTLRGVPSQMRADLSADASDGSNDSIYLGEISIEPNESRPRSISRLE
jgi:hypothetical protein